MAKVDDLRYRYERALNTARMALWESTIPDNHVEKGEVIWTGEGASLLGRPKTGFRQSFRSFMELIHPHDRPHVQQTFEDALLNLKDYELEYRVICPNGAVSWLAARGHIVTDANQQPCKTLGIIWDINEKKRLSEKLHFALRAATMVIWESDISSGRVHFTAQGAALLGMPKQAFDCNFDGFLEHVHALDRQHVTQVIEEAIKARRSYQLEYRVVWPDESVHWIAAKGDTYVNADNQPERTLGLLWDITEQKEMELALAEQKELAEVTLSSIGDGIITIDNSGKVRYLNHIAEYLTGWPSDAAKGRHITEVFRVVDGATGQSIDNIALKCLETGRRIGMPGAASMLSCDGRETWIEDSASPIIAPDGKILGAVIVIHDVSHERELKHELSWQAAHDPLTGLINRREFDDQLARILANAKHTNEHSALLYLDLDQFKIVNDTCGHVAGDELLRQLACVVHSHMRESDVFARLGGDEFGILLIGCGTEQALHLADKVRQAVRDFRFAWDRHVFEIGVSIGLVPLESETISATDALSAADRACYIAKEQGRNKVHLFQIDDAMLAERHGEMLWIARLASAFREKRFQLYWQPIQAIGASNGLHSEVLLRMLDEHGQLVSPGAFLPAAERYDQVASLDHWVVENCLRLLNGRMPSMAAIHHDGRSGMLPHVYSINLSGTSLGDKGLLPFIEDKLEQYQIDPACICFEITETAVVRNLVQAKHLMATLRKRGCQFALDDFGSGLSSFSYLKNFPVDYLKIDGAFVKGVAKDPISRAMVESINHVGHVMGLKTIAEYVEDDAVLQAVREIGVDYAQGHAIGRPQPLH